ncbi:XRE family transcriptional regulator [Hyphomicrobium sp.]|uniref:XRE family transcriptional regulator n=1 Tax=Hyphomicrobium sp. TaxID=82 RepID=UPI000F9DB2E0|nr:MAG: hypothetical protein EKK38_01995 [Hyphomicrobium sp.]
MKPQSAAAKLSAHPRRSAFKPDHSPSSEADTFERWAVDLDQSRKLVAAQIIDSVRSKWGTAVALQAATGISQTEISRLRHGKFERFSLERLVRLLRIVDPEVEIKLQVTVMRKSQPRTSKIRQVP